MSLPSNNSKYTLKKISLRQKQRCFRVAILGQNGVGKSALTVRFLTRRFIGEYDPTLEQVYRINKPVHGRDVDFEILDTAIQKKYGRCTVYETEAGHAHIQYTLWPPHCPHPASNILTTNYLLKQVYRSNKPVHGRDVDFEILDTAIQHENNCMEENIRWADAFILMYSVTDTCSFNECCRLKFLINSYCKKRRPLRMTSDPSSKVTISTAPVILVGNQIDKIRDRMVTFDEGRRRACEMGCVGFYEVSVSEMIDRITEIFDDLYITFKSSKHPPVKKSQSFIRTNKDCHSSSEEDDQIKKLPETTIFNPARRSGI